VSVVTSEHLRIVAARTALVFGRLVGGLAPPQHCDEIIALAADLSAVDRISRVADLLS